MPLKFEVSVNLTHQARTAEETDDDEGTKRLPALNDAGTVAFKGFLDDGDEGIFTSAGGPTTTIADRSGPFSRFGDTSINEAGTVAFRAFLDEGGQGVFTGAGGPTTTIADSSGPFSRFNEPSINDAGTVAFRATLDGGGFGIFTGADPVADAVIGVGDLLDGAMVRGLGFFRDGLNNLGSLAFSAVLSDGRQAIFRADPVSGTIPAIPAIPEPATLSLFALGLLALGLIARRRIHN